MALKIAVDAAMHWLRPSHPKARNRRLLAVALACGAAWGLFGGSQGLFALLTSQHEKARLRSEITQLRESNKGLEAQVARWAAHPEAYEKTARERLLLMRPGDTLYRFH